MNPRRWHLNLLHCAALLVPRAQRGEWYAEWSSELWYVRESSATAFCLGAVRDALWLRCHYPISCRLESPLQCLALLTILAVAGLMISWRLPFEQETRDLDGVVLVRPVGHRGVRTDNVRLADYRIWNNDRQRVFTRLTFYTQGVVEPVVSARHRLVHLSIARASDNLLDVLHVSLPAPRPRGLVLTRKAWREFFASDPQIVGRVFGIDGRAVAVAAVLPEEIRSLPGHPEAWLLQDAKALAELLPDCQGFVLAQVRQPSTYRMSVPDDNGGRDSFDCIPLAPGRLIAGYVMILMMSGLLLPVTTSLSLGDYPGTHNLRRWLFLAAKLVLLLVMIYCAVRWVAYHRADPGILLGSLAALRWAIVDQRRRCPVCLRLLSNPVRVGQPSQIFLEWYGTEFICTRGHGLLHVPEIPTSCYSRQRWQVLDPSWSSLFRL